MSFIVLLLQTTRSSKNVVNCPTLGGFVFGMLFSIASARTKIRFGRLAKLFRSPSTDGEGVSCAESGLWCHRSSASFQHMRSTKPARATLQHRLPSFLA